MSPRRVVHASCVNIEDLLVKPPLRRPDVPDALQQLVKVVLLALARRILQPLIVEDKALYDVFPQQSGGPDAETGGQRAFHSVAHGNSSVEIVETGRVGLAIGGSSKEILYYRIVNQFPLGKNDFQMLPDVLLRRLKQFGHVLLRQPDRFTLKPHVDLQSPVLRLVNEKLSTRRWRLGILADGFISFSVKM